MYQKWNNDECRCECKKHHICEKNYISDPCTCSCENGKYLASVIEDSVITCNEIVDAVAGSLVERRRNKHNSNNF